VKNPTALCAGCPRGGTRQPKDPVVSWPAASLRTGRIVAASGWAVAAFLFFALCPFSLQAARVEFRIHEANTTNLLPCRIHLAGPDGKAVRPPTLPFWHDHFVCEGGVALDLPPGRYRFTIERGPEWSLAQSELMVDEGGAVTATASLARLAHLSREGWWAGDLHVHRPLAEIERLMRAEGLHIAPVITWWNNRGPWATSPPPTERVTRFDGYRFHERLAGEDERGGGALLYFGLPQPLNLDGAAREFPPSLDYLRQAKASASATPGAWADIEKPFWWDTPVWLASGLVDSVGIAHNHLQRSGVLDNEAWGRPRDRERYPGPQGNGRYTQDLYYHILNCGFRLPPSAGSASGVLPNPVGYNRVYVQLDGELTWQKWWDGLRAGRVFVSNGPLLRARANGQWPGHEFQSDGPLRVLLEAQLDSRDPVVALELVRDGHIEPITLPRLITIQESGWFLLRAVADVPQTFRFASTGPWYVRIGGRPLPVRRESAQTFLDWTRLRATNLAAALTRETQRTQSLQPLREAGQFWERKVAQAATRVTVTGSVVDAETAEPLPARVYLRRADGRWFFPESAVADGSAIRYERQNWVNPDAVEYHTTLSAHPFRVALEPGSYTLTVERGKEYRPLVHEFTVQAAPLDLRLALRRWANLAARGWFSGDTHVHRSPAELPNVMLAEDLNVAFPLTYWVTKGLTPPSQGDKSTAVGIEDHLVSVDATHVFWPRNTEWEIFTVDGKRHTLGAVFALGHREPLALGAPPVGPVAEAARHQGASLDLDKHDWPWSMALVPLMNVDLFELANNHHWRTDFGITNWSTPAPAWMRLPNEGRNGTERDWTLYGFQNYYALLNCGFRLRPAAGTASGVHPVPLGFSRVYVHLPGGFDYAAWLKGLNAGRSFVTTGPMLLATVNGQPPGHAFHLSGNARPVARVAGELLSEEPLESVEILRNGEVVKRLVPLVQTNADTAFIASVAEDLELEGSGWVALRCWEARPGGRWRFAHTAPWFFDVANVPLRPRRHEVEFLVQRVRQEWERSRAVLPAQALDEYRRALAAFEKLRENARP